MCIFDRSNARSYHLVIRLFGSLCILFVEEDIIGPGQRQVAINLLFLNQIPDSL